MFCKIAFLFAIITISNLTCGEPNLPAAKARCPTCVKYTGSIKMLDLYNDWNYVVTNDGYFPDQNVAYRSFHSTKGIRAFYIIKDPLKPVPEPLIDLDVCSMHDVNKGLTSFYDLTTILATYILPVGLPCKEAMGKRPMPLQLRSTYYLIREPTPCNHFNITVQIATLEAKLTPYITMIFTVTKPGKSCDSSVPKTVKTASNNAANTKPTKL